MKTYVSLFSSAGIGCYGFKQAGFECIATNEFLNVGWDDDSFLEFETVNYNDVIISINCHYALI